MISIGLERRKIKQMNTEIIKLLKRIAVFSFNKTFRELEPTISKWIKKKLKQEEV